MNDESLTQNGVVHISAFFEGPFILQAFSVRKCTPPGVGLQMCLTDGRVYIGAKYNSADYPQVQDYWLLQVTAKFVSQTQPIIIKTLQVASTYPKKLLGVPPCTLTDYFNKEIGRQGEERMGQPSKKIKYSNSFGQPLLKNSDNKKPGQKQKIPNTFTTLSPNVYRKREEHKAKNDTERKGNEKKLKIADSDEEEEASIMLKKEVATKRMPTPTVQIDGDSDNILKNSLISDLYERRAGWVILCRINYVNRVECKDGNLATNFMITDEEGDEIKCVYFENRLDVQKITLEAGKYYSFSNGEISRGNKNDGAHSQFKNDGTRDHKNDGARQLQITFDKTSTIVPRENIQFDLNLSKVSRIGSIPNREPNTEINVIGIIKSIKIAVEMSKAKRKYSATICDPLTNHEIDLLLFLNSFEEPPVKGAIGILHNYQLYKQNNIYRLNSTYRSYFRQETKFKDSLTSEFKRVKSERDWQKIYYKNLSNVAFSFRTIQDLKNIFRYTDDERIFSLIDCWAMDISRKKFYNACKSCKKVTEKKDAGTYYCPSCKKQVQTSFSYTLTVHFADYTSSVVVDVIGEHAETLLEMKAGQFSELPPDRQLEHLDSLRYKNLTIKLKTEKKGDKKEMHSVWAIEQSHASSSLFEIKKRLVNDKMKLEDKW